MEKLLVINPGSTSTKIAYYEGENEVWKENIKHAKEDLSKFANTFEQQDMRYALVLKAMDEHGTDAAKLDAVVSRGGPVAPMRSGAYKINDAMINRILTNPFDMHVSLIGAVIAKKFGDKFGYDTYIYDAVSVDEMYPVCKLTGLPFVKRRVLGHALNMRAAAIKYCADNGMQYGKSTLIVAHLGGGITVSFHENGRIGDIVCDEDGPFAPERAGQIPTLPMLELCFGGEYSKAEIAALLKGKGGLVSWLGTNDTIEVEKMIADGNKEAELVYSAMALNVARAIGRLSIMAPGSVQQIILTGGIAYSQMFTDMITEKVSWIAPVSILPGENEMDALAKGCLRVLRGTEEAHNFEDN